MKLVKPAVAVSSAPIHRGGGGGLAVARARAEVMDVMIRHIYDAVRAA